MAFLVHRAILHCQDFLAASSEEDKQQRSHTIHLYIRQFGLHVPGNEEAMLHNVTNGGMEGFEISAQVLLQRVGCRQRAHTFEAEKVHRFDIRKEDIGIEEIGAAEGRKEFIIVLAERINLGFSPRRIILFFSLESLPKIIGTGGIVLPSRLLGVLVQITVFGHGMTAEEVGHLLQPNIPLRNRIFRHHFECIGGRNFFLRNYCLLFMMAGEEGYRQD